MPREGKKNEQDADRAGEPRADHAFVILAYQASPFLGGAIRSVCAQSRSSRIVVSTSTPNAHIEAAASEANAPVIVNPDRAGISADWNFALCATGARYVTLVHQDDVYHRDFLDETLKTFGEFEGALCFTGYQEIDDDGRPVSSKISRAKHLIERVALANARCVSGLRLRAFLSFGNPLPCSSITFDRARAPDFRFSSAYSSNLDWDAWWRLMEAGETFLRSPRRLVGRRHNALTTTSKLLANGVRAREDAMMFRKAWPRPLADAIAFAYRAGY